MIAPSRLPPGSSQLGTPGSSSAITARNRPSASIRAYDARTGRELWKGRLPAGGNATPMTYWSRKSGRQFVVIAAGGHGGILSGYSDQLIAFALPRK